MSVKRYQMQESAFGPFVPYKDFFKLENDYAALIARNNELVEAVKKMRKFEEGVPSDIDEILYGNYVKNKIAARAEVDRLLEEK